MTIGYPLSAGEQSPKYHSSIDGKGRAIAKLLGCTVWILIMVIGTMPMAAAESGSLVWVVRDGKVVAQPSSIPSGARGLTTSGSTGGRIPTPNIQGVQDKHSGIAEVADEVAKYLGYFQEARKREAVQKEAETRLRAEMNRSGDSYGLLNVFSDKPPDLSATPMDPSFSLQMRPGPAVTADTPSAAAIRLGVMPDGDRPAMSAAPAGQSSGFPNTLYILTASRGPDGKVHVAFADRATLLKQSKEYMEKQSYRTGQDYEIAQSRKARASAEHARAPTAQSKRELEETSARADQASKEYAAQRRAREERTNLDVERQRACSGGSADCGKATERQLRWYDNAEKAGKTGMVSPGSDDPGQSDTPGNPSTPRSPPPPWAQPEPKTPRAPDSSNGNCGLCDVGSIGDSYLGSQTRFAELLNSSTGQFSMPAYLKRLREKPLLVPGVK